MENAKKISSRTLAFMVIGALVLFGLGVVGVVQSSRAQLAYFSEQYVAGIAQTHLGVNLTENGTVVEGKDALLGQLLAGDDQLVPGKEYAEALSVKNDTDMGEYVRLTVRKYWETADGSKVPAIDPALIELVSASEDWVLNEDECTDERLVFYYKHVLDPNASAASPAVSAIMIDPSVIDLLGDDASVRVALSAQVDSVQTSYAVDAAKSAWGVDVKALGLGWNEGASE
ncbi:MAG TPA: hypothetical protein OIM11_00040 [Coriobacteriaceae bacterium]|nr:hypothetical protein [Coriobacteriaceae bacterium]